MLENHNTEDFSGLESLGNSQIIENVGTFLSLEDLGLKPEGEAEYIPLDNVNLTKDNIPPVTTEQEIKVKLPILTEGEKTGEGDLEGLNTLDEGVTEESDVNILPTGNSDYKSILRDLMSEGLLPEIEAFDTDEGEVSFEDMNIDKETLLSLIKSSQDDIKEQMKASSIDVNGVSEFTKKLINIEKNGGNVQQALQTYQQVKHPIETIDLSDLAGQKAMCYLRFKAQGIEDSMAKDLIKAYEMQGVLEEKSHESKEQLDEAFNQSIIQQEEVAIKEQQEFKVALKTYRGTLDSVLKEQQITDTHRRKLLDIATKQTEQGDFELDVYIENFRKNPIDAADLLMFVTNKDEFIKRKSDVLLKEERKKTLRKVSIIPKGTSSNLTIPEQTTKTDPYLLDLSKL